MADFSQYGGASQEWLEVEKTLPRPWDPNTPLDELKRIVNGAQEQGSAKELEEFAFKVRILDHTIPTRDGSSIEARSYRPVSKPASERLPVYIHLHGGGFLFGSLASEDGSSAKLASNIEIVVLNVNYRHTPEHTFPTAWYDSQDSFAWLHDHISEVGGDPEKVVVGGVSAGAQLTASLALEKHLGKVLQRYPDIAGQVLLIPALAHPATHEQNVLPKIKEPRLWSYKENKDAAVVSAKAIETFVDLLKTGPIDVNDTKLNIISATPDQVKGLPPTVFGVAGLDPLRDEALLYAKLLSEAGVPTDTTLFKGVPHAYRRVAPAIKASQDWDEAIEQGILWAFGKPKATGKFDVKVLAR